LVVVAEDGVEETRNKVCVHAVQILAIKKEILKLVETYVKKAEDLDGVNANLIPGLLDSFVARRARAYLESRPAGK
jgi:hypothetical protein